MTLSDLVATLKTQDPQAPLVFATPDAEIGGGYHVTELKVLNITSIDCAGRTSEWREAAVQLLDGRVGEHMKVGKFVGILENSLRKVQGLGDAPAHVEFSPNNEGLQRYEIKFGAPSKDQVLIRLATAQATCKPASVFKQRSKAVATNSRCCA